MTVVSGSDREQGFHQQTGPKELPEGHQLEELMGMVVETRDWVHGASMIDDPHTTLTILQLHMRAHTNSLNHPRGTIHPKKQG